MSNNLVNNCKVSDQSYCRFGADALAKLLKVIEGQIQGVEQSDDIEYVHKMRVTSRRIRAALPLFKECFPKKRYKNWLNEVKKVTRFLGATRDLDVQINVVKTYIDGLAASEPKSGLQELFESRVNQRTETQNGVLEGLQELRKSRVLPQAKCFCQEIVKDAASTPFNLFEVRDRAFWHISAKLDDFLSMEEWVHKENEVLKLHEMRIKAKWLRYTMETFAPLYEKELKDEIETIKYFQDTLGEMHDCDVWIQQIPAFVEEACKEGVAGVETQKAADVGTEDLLKFLDYIKAKRRNYYEKFVRSWDEKKSKNYFEELRKNASAGFTAAEYRTKAELNNPNVKVGLLSDIHGNLHALEAVFRDAESRGVTVFLNAGDITGFGAFPNEVIEALYCKNSLSVIGNYDLEVLDLNNRGKGAKKFSLEFTRKELGKSCEAYLHSLPLKLELEIARRKFLLVHGTPDSVEEHLYITTTEERFKQIAEASGASVVVFGHSHEQFTKTVDGALFVNPGSVGRPGDGNPQAAYAVLTVNPFSVELVRVSYDVESAANALRQRGAPESYAQMLLRGVALDSIISEDEARCNNMEEKCGTLAKSVQEISQKYWPDVEHSDQVSKLSLELFDDLQSLHELSQRERCWLECAAILHDIGMAKGSKDHHRTTMNLILDEPNLPFSSTERRIIANIARYHRKRGPKSKHYNFTSLNAEQKHKVRMLAGILRLADGLDFSHQAIVQKVDAHVAFDYVTIVGVVNLSPMVEEYSINRKKDVFEQVFKKKLVVAWRQNLDLHKQRESVSKEEPLQPSKNTQFFNPQP